MASEEYEPGDKVKYSGVYRVIHDRKHIEPHDVTIWRAAESGVALALAMVLPHPTWASPRGLRHPRSRPAIMSRGIAPREQDAVEHAPCAVRRNVLTYHGGALVQNPDVFLLFWGSQWSNDAAHIAAKNSLIAMYQAIGTSDFACAWREYGVSAEPLGNGTYSGSYVIGAAPPNPLDDSMIQSQIVAEVAAGHAPPRTDDRIYVVVPPSGVPVSAGGETGCGGSNFTFCGYHDSFERAGAFRYAVLPFPCTVPGQGTCFVDPAEDVSQAFQVVGSHELTETVTDPDNSPGGWFSDRTGDENADICASDACVDTITSGIVSFAVNPAWSNLAKGCITSIPCVPAPIECTDPSPGACSPGKGTTSACSLEFLVDPNLTLRRSSGLPTSIVSCTDGQTLCDFDATASQCTFHVAACLNNQDPRLSCSLTTVRSIGVVQPSANDPVASLLLAGLQNVDPASAGNIAGNTLTYTPAAATPNACTSYMDVIVPAGAKSKIRLLLDTSSGTASSGLFLICNP
jgi:serine protease